MKKLKRKNQNLLLMNQVMMKEMNPQNNQIKIVKILIMLTTQILINKVVSLPINKHIQVQMLVILIILLMKF
jgi:hypothetical protein